VFVCKPSGDIEAVANQGTVGKPLAQPLLEMLPELDADYIVHVRQDSNGDNRPDVVVNNTIWRGLPAIKAGYAYEAEYGHWMNGGMLAGMKPIDGVPRLMINEQRSLTMMTNHDAEPCREGSVAALIRERRSIQKYKPDPVALETLTELLDTAVWAPNHGLREPWRFIVFKDEGKQLLTDVIGSFLTQGPWKMDPEAVENRMQYFRGIPLLLLVVMPLHSQQHERDEDFAAASALIQNLQLAAWERGIGVLWRTNPFIAEEEVKEQLGVGREERIVGLLQMGYPEAIPSARPRTPAADRLTVVDSAAGYVAKQAGRSAAYSDSAN